MVTNLEVAKVWMLEERRQLLVDILVEGINCGSFTGAILQDTFQLAKAGVYWILLLSSGTQLATSNGQPRCKSQKQNMEQRTLHCCDQASMLLQNLDFAFLLGHRVCNQYVPVQNTPVEYASVLWIQSSPTNF